MRCMCIDRAKDHWTVVKRNRRGFFIVGVVLIAISLNACGGGSGAITPPPELLQPPTTAAQPVLSFEAVKTFRFTWNDVGDATHYRLLENPDGSSGFVQVGNDIAPGAQEFDYIVPLYARTNALYILESCNAAGCNSSSSVAINGALVDAVGYFKAGNPEEEDHFGQSVSLSADGETLAVGAPWEDSNASEVDGDTTDNSAVDSGAVYVFAREDGAWRQQAYLKASNSRTGDYFGIAVSLSDDGNTLAVGARFEDSAATGINDFATNLSALNSGAAYLFGRRRGEWSQQAYIKASNTGATDQFGAAISISGDGRSLAVGASAESSVAEGVNGEQSDNSSPSSGAVYVFRRDDAGWGQDAYIKASNTSVSDAFGHSVDFSRDGGTLVVGARFESSAATGINGDQENFSGTESGAVYVFVRDNGVWNQQAYVKASNTGIDDQFGISTSLSADGDTLAVGAQWEDSAAVGIDGDQSNNALQNAGAVYLFSRESGVWEQRAYLKPNNSDISDIFGFKVSLSSDARTLAVAAHFEDSNAIGINGDHGNNSLAAAGAVTIFKMSDSVWRQHAYVKASNPDAVDLFGHALSLSGDGNTLAVGARNEASNSSGINDDQSDNSAPESGAVYIY